VGWVDRRPSGLRRHKTAGRAAHDRAGTGQHRRPALAGRFACVGTSHACSRAVYLGGLSPLEWRSACYSPKCREALGPAWPPAKPQLCGAAFSAGLMRMTKLDLLALDQTGGGDVIHNLVEIVPLDAREPSADEAIFLAARFTIALHGFTNGHRRRFQRISDCAQRARISAARDVDKAVKTAAAVGLLVMHVNQSRVMLTAKGRDLMRWTDF
jgi:hypothetical protein